MRSQLSWLVLGPTVAISLLLLVVGIAAAAYVHRLNRDVARELAEHLSATLAAEHLVLTLRDLRLDLDRFEDTADSIHWNAAVAARREIERSLDEVARGAPAGEPRDLAAQTHRAYRRFAADLESASNQPQDARPASIAKLKSAITYDVLTPAEELLAYRRATASKGTRRHQAAANRVKLGLLLLGICGAVAGLTTGYGFARGLRRSMTQLSVPVRDMAGRLNEIVGPITIASEADWAGLEHALHAVSERTAEVVQRLQQAQHDSLRFEQLAALGQLAAGLAHELRNPLTSMKLLVQAATEKTAALLPDDLAILQEEILRLEAMLQTFLDFARPPRPQMQPVALPQVIDRALRVVGPRAAQQEVNIHCQFSARLATVDGDTAQLHQMVLNLLLNALDALPRGGNIWISITAGNAVAAAADAAHSTDHAQLNPRLSLSISDDGNGLPEDDPNRIFEPFVSTKPTGMGLGLSICKQIAEAHGADIIATNRDDGGAEFTVRLPLHVEAGGHTPIATQHCPPRPEHAAARLVAARTSDGAHN